MLDNILGRFAEATLVILGFGREGEASYSLLRRYFPEKHLFISDSREDIRLSPLLKEDSEVTLMTGPDYMLNIERFDYILRSPGIRMNNRVPLIPAEKITSQTDLFLQAFAPQVIGVTGTKGKSTTASLIHHILKTAGEDSVLVGNIGNPAFHYIERIRPETRVVFELSSHQLEYTQCSPHISVILNLFQEHLDAYSGYLEYQLAKINIAKHQRPGDFLIYHADDPLVLKHVTDLGERGGLIPFSLKDSTVGKIHQDRFLRGDHNLKNIMASIAVVRLLGVSAEAIEDGIATFKGLEHRLEYVGHYHGIHFYNDSIATIPEACMEAINAIPKVDTLVAGGFDRGIDYSGLAAFILGSQVTNLILVGAAGKRIGLGIEALGKHAKKIYYINRFDYFYEIALRETRPGYSCLLSPAAASYDEFKNFEERGIRFRELVKN